MEQYYFWLSIFLAYTTIGSIISVYLNYREEIRGAPKIENPVLLTLAVLASGPTLWIFLPGFYMENK